MENSQEQELTTEQLQERKEQMLKFYTESLPYLKAQHEYEKLLADIDGERLRRAQYNMQFAMLMQQGEEQLAQEKDAESTDENKSRKLKKS